ncbi:MAG: PGF-pre-PGF domain-containing protein [Candidatus Micrarchaeota archaeon]|nr:PGF-pre-PGF domain-containing protein [Candidatus Micrarchaeota archaeon]
MGNLTGNLLTLIILLMILFVASKIQLPQLPQVPSSAPSASQAQQQYAAHHGNSHLLFASTGNQTNTLSSTSTSSSTTTLSTSTTTSSTTSASTTSVTTTIALLGFDYLTVSNSTATQGQSETLTAAITGGTAPYAYNFIVSNTNTGNIIFQKLVSSSQTQGSTGFSLPAEANDVGTLTVRVNITDSRGAGISASNSMTVSAANSIQRFAFIGIYASNKSAAQGQYELLTARVTGGEPPYTYSFAVSNTNTGNSVFAAQVSNSLTSNSVSFTLPVESNDIGTLIITANVLDSSGSGAFGSNTISVASAPKTTTTSTTSTITSTSTTTVGSSSTSSTTTSVSTSSTTTIPAIQNYVSTFNGTNGRYSFQGTVGSRSRITLSKSVLRNIEINFTAQNLQANITISNSSAVPSSLTQPRFGVYQFMQINGSIGTGKNNIDLYVNNATYNFSVPSSWIAQENTSVSSIRLFKYYPGSGSWNALPTSLAGSNATSYFYTADSNSLSGYVVGFTYNGVTSTTATVSNTLGTNYMSYFFGVASHTQPNTASKSISWTNNSNETNGVSTGQGAKRYTNLTAIGRNTLGNFGSVTLSATTYSQSLVSYGANVANTAVADVNIITVNTLGSTASLTYTEKLSNSLVLLIFGVAGDAGATISTPQTGCATLQTATEGSTKTGTKVVIQTCNALAPGPYTAQITSTSGDAAAVYSISSYVYSPTNILLLDYPATGNIITNGTQQANGNVITVLGTNTLVPVAPTGYSFSGFTVYAPNTANVILSPTSGTTNTITVLGDAIISANYIKNGITITSQTVSNAIADQGQVEALSVSISALATTTPYTYNYLVTNTQTSNVIYASQQSSSSTSNSVSFTLPYEQNAIGTLTFTANVVDSSATPYNALATTTFTAYNGFFPVAITSSPNPAQGSPVTLNMIVTGGKSSYTYNFLVTNTFVTPVNIVYNSIVSGIAATNEISTFTIPTSSQNVNSIGTLTLTGNVLDSASTVNNVLITNTMTVVAPPPPSLTFTATPSTVLAGQTETFTATASGGTGPFTIEFYNVTGSKNLGGNVVIASPGGSNTLYFQAGPNNGISYTYNAIGTDQGTSTVFNSISSTITVSGANAVNEIVGWSFSSPTGMMQDPVFYDTYAYNGLTFQLHGWNLTSDVVNGINSIQIVPVNALGGFPTNGLIGQASTVSTSTQHSGEATRLPWLLTPLGDFRWGPVLWAGNVVDTGNTLMDMLQGGLLNVYYANVPTGYVIQWKSGNANAPTSIGSGIYTLGGIRIKVITGSVGALSTTTSVSPTSGTIQFVVYNDTLFDTNSLDLLGAVNSVTPAANTIPDVVVENNRFTKEKSMEVTLTNFAVTSDYIAVNPGTDTAGNGLYLLDNGVLVNNAGQYFYPGLYVINATAQSTDKKWDVTTQVESANRGTGAGTYRHLYPNFADARFTTSTFNIYGSFAEGTETKWDVGRIVQPYTISYYPSSGTLLYYFPQASDDAQNSASLANVVNTVVTWAFQDSNHTWIETGNWIANVGITLTGEGGNSVDMGYRHWLSNLGSGTPQEYLAENIINPIGWTVKSSPSGGYFYPVGNAGYNIGPVSTDSYFTLGRYWKGATSVATSNVIAEFQTTNQYVLGFMRNFSSGSLSAGESWTTDGAAVAYANANIPTYDNANAMYQKFNNAVPNTQTYTLNGMVDLSGGGAYTDYAWDIGWQSGAPTIFNMSNKPSAATCIPTITNTLINFGSLQAGFSTATQNAMPITNAGTATGNIIIYSTSTTTGNWIYFGNSFLTGNTLWDLSKRTANNGNQLTNSITTDTFNSLASSDTADLFFGLNVPAGQATGTYTQGITVALSCG